MTPAAIRIWFVIGKLTIHKSHKSCAKIVLMLLRQRQSLF
jgi:hypothetical protein